MLLCSFSNMRLATSSLPGYARYNQIYADCEEYLTRQKNVAPDSCCSSFQALDEYTRENVLSILVNRYPFIRSETFCNYPM